MKKLVVFLIASAIGLGAFAQNKSFISPEAGDIISAKYGVIDVFWSIEDYDPSYTYWVAIATVRDAKSINKINDICESGVTDENKKEYLQLINSWNINNFFPKFPIEEASGSGKIFEKLNVRGCKPFIILLIKTNNSTKNEYIDKWLKGGVTDYPGIPFSFVKAEQLEQYPILYKKD